MGHEGEVVWTATFMATHAVRGADDAGPTSIVMVNSS
jgi:hypothetical protein